jgi:hypothetical protein
VFEVTPCGTLGVFERVSPIKNRQTFMSVAEDVFTLINEWLLGEYVLDDIGSNYFMNYGIRKGFGVVLLDFPYMFKVDRNKLICCLEDKTHTTKSGKCEGEIDYDDGYNKLICTKCGAVYKAIDLAEAIKNDKIIINKGEDIMALNIKISGGSKNNEKEIKTEPVQYAKATPSKNVKPVSNNSGIIGAGVERVDKSLNTKLNIKISKQDTKVEEEAPEMAVNGVSTTPEVAEIVSEQKQVEEHEEKAVEPIITPITIHDENSDKIKDIAKKAEEDIKKIENGETPEVDIYDLLVNSDQDKVREAITKYIFGFYHINPEFTDLSVVEDSDRGTCIVTSVTMNLVDDSEENVIKLMDSDDNIDIKIPVANIKAVLGNKAVDLVNAIEYNGYAYYAAKVINQKDLFGEVDAAKILVLVDARGNYVTDSDGQVIAINLIDNKVVSNLSIVSTTWVKELEKAVGEVESDSEENNDVKEAPVGAAADMDITAVTEEE